MDPAVWSRIKSLAFDALDKEPSARSAFLDVACAGDLAVRSEVERLVRAQEQAERNGFLTPPDAPAIPEPPQDAGALIGVRIGNYRIRRLVGMGGMGAVYEAIQDHPRRTVALKVMRAGLASPSLLRRFEYEAQLLARLRHPGIAQVFEAGAHEGPKGPVPYFAMEYIPAARPVTVYARENRLDVRRRIALLASVCDGVQHGHQRGVVHRDLKPSNILVDASGATKIIDFGVARATDSDMSVTSFQTNVGQLVGTLQYMSPEQCAADPNDIDTRSDIYSLGVVLFELLTGRLPYDVSTVPVYDAPRLIREQAPDRPSAIDPALKGDLSIITLKAMEKDRAHRYQTAAELALDLRRWLDGEAIAARPPSVVYQLRIFARRHRVLVISGVAVVLALLSGAIVAGIGMRWALDAQRLSSAAATEATRQAERSARIATFLTSVLGSADPTVGLVASDLRSAQDLDFSPWDSFRQAGLEPAGPPGQAPTVAGMLIAASRRLDEAFPDDPSIRAELALLIGSTLERIGEWNEGLPHMQRAVALFRDVKGPDDESTIAAVLRLGASLAIRADYASADELYRQALDSCLRIFGPVDPRTLQAGRIRTFNLVQVPGRQREAAETQKSTADRLTHLLGAESPVTQYEMSHYAAILEAAGQYSQAEPIARRAAEALAAGGSSERRKMDALAILAHILRTVGGRARLEEATAIQFQVVEYYRRRMGTQDGATYESRKALIEMLMVLGRAEQAEPVAREVLESRRKLYGAEALDTYKAGARLARVLIAAGKKLDEAETLAQFAADGTRSLNGPREDYAVYHMTTLADARRARGQAEPARRLCESLLAEGTATGNSAWTRAYLHGVLGECLTDLERLDEAAEVLAKASAETEEWGDPSSAIRVGVIRAGIRLFEKAGKREEAARWQALLPGG